MTASVVLRASHIVYQHYRSVYSLIDSLSLSLSLSLFSRTNRNLQPIDISRHSNGGSPKLRHKRGSSTASAQTSNSRDNTLSSNKLPSMSLR